MLDMISASPSPSLSITDEEVERRKKLIGLEADDIAHVMSLSDIVQPRVDHHAEVFFKRLMASGGAPGLFARRDALEEARLRKREHLRAMVRGKIDREYVEQRVDLAALYSVHGMEANAFVGAFHHLMQSIADDIFSALRDDTTNAFLKYTSLTKIGYFDISVITDVLMEERQRTINAQQEAIRELSTPVLRVRDRLLVLPIIGVLDSLRAKQLTDDLLQAIRANRSKIVVMDITGVAAVDSKVANHLIQTVTAARLMGSAVIITGLSAEVAQALVALGIGLDGIETTSDLQSGLELAERVLGYRMVRAEESDALGRETAH